MGIKSWFKKYILGWEEELTDVPTTLEPQPPKPEPLPEPPSEITHKEAVRMKHGREGLEELKDCFFGTRVQREPGEHGYPNRIKHLKDGWRGGFSHPFEFGGRAYDVIKKFDGSHDVDATVAQYEKLKKQLEDMAENREK